MKLVSLSLIGAVGVVNSLRFDQTEYVANLNGSNKGKILVIVTNDDTSDINVALSFNQTMPDDKTPLATQMLTLNNQRSMPMNSNIAAASIFHTNEPMHKLLVFVENTKEELQSLQQEIVQCLQTHSNDCGVQRNTSTNKCFPTVQFLLNSGMVVLDYDPTFPYCQEADAVADLEYLQAHLRVSSYEADAEIFDGEERPVAVDLQSDKKGAESLHRLRSSNNRQPVDDWRWNDQWHMVKENIPEAWKLLKYTPDNFHPIVQVVDSGTYLEHPDLASNLWVNEAEKNGRPGVDDDGNGYVDDILGWTGSFGGKYFAPNDYDGHGTHCAGIVGAVVNNTYGIAGFGNNIKVAVCRRFDHKGVCTNEALQECWDWGMAIGAHISSNSYGDLNTVMFEMAATRRSYQKMQDAGVLVLNSAGNESSDLNNRYWQLNGCLNAPNQLTVAATNRDGYLADFTNYGERCVELAAPGERILSTFDPKFDNNEYYWMSGTSMATPFVAGIAAMILNANPYLDALDLKRILRNSIKPHPDMARPRTLYGGIPDAIKAIQLTRPTNVRSSFGDEWDQLRFRTIKLLPGQSMVYSLDVLRESNEDYLGQLVAYDVDVEKNYKVKSKVTADLKVRF